MTIILVFGDDGQPGITRRKSRMGWAYYDADGRRISEREEISRLDAIALPPAYTDAWFCPQPNGHLQATGKDARGRKQYRYHPEFRAARDSAKFDGLADFGRLLPRVRARVAKDIVTRSLTRDRAIACIIRLLDSTAIRIGNESYVQSNSSFGATTLRMKHATLAGHTLKLRFRAKSGKLVTTALTDRSLARFVRAMQDLPGQHLFQFIDANGEPAAVGSADVNSYIRDAMGADYTAKHFRTWAASVEGFELLASGKGLVSLKELLDQVSAKLGNTPAVARKAYLHPAIIALAQDRDSQTRFVGTLRLPRRTRWLSRHERGLIDYLELQRP